MAQAAREEINFWPAYVDALINVVLNLLFLVGVFTIGLVSLNGEAFLAEQRASQIKLEALRQARTEQERQNLRREMLRALAVPPPSKFAIPHEPQQASNDSFRVKEIRFAAAGTTAQVGGGGADIAASQVPSYASVQQFVAAVVKGGEITRIEFQMNQYSQPDGWSWPGQLDHPTERKWLLVVVGDPTNSRLSREAFARLVFVRKTLVAANVPPKNIQLQVLPAPEALAVSPEAERTVFAIQSVP
jgi:hypothetical protein